MAELDSDYTGGAKNFFHHMIKNRKWTNIVLILLVLLFWGAEWIYPNEYVWIGGIFVSVIYLGFILRSIPEYKQMKKGIKK